MDVVVVVVVDYNKMVEPMVNLIIITKNIWRSIESKRNKEIDSYL